MIKFEAVSKFKDIENDILPTRKTAQSAGYDFVVAEDVIVPPYGDLMYELSHYEIFKLHAEKDNLEKEEFDAKTLELSQRYEKGISLNDLSALTKATKAKPTLVSTGVKCALEPDTYLELSVRSSTPLKHWLILANSVGIIDADYYNNPDNEGEIFFQLINLSPWPIILKRGDCIGQGIIKGYGITDNDCATGERIGGFGSTSTVIDNAVENLINFLSDSVASSKL